MNGFIVGVLREIWAKKSTSMVGTVLFKVEESKNHNFKQGMFCGF